MEDLRSSTQALKSAPNANYIIKNILINIISKSINYK